MPSRVSDSGAQVLIADRERFDRIEPLLDSLRLPSVIVVRDEQGELPPGVERWNDVCGGFAGRSLPDALVEADDISTIVYTSGTTGTPKGAVHLHRNHCTSVMNNLLFMEVGRVMGATAPGEQEMKQAASLLTFPFFHIAGLVNLYLPLSSGSKLVLMHRWVVEHRGQPDRRRADHDDRRRADRSSRVARLGTPHGVEGHVARLAHGGSASVTAPLVRRVGEQYGDRAAPGNGYGLTETTAGVIAAGGAEYLAHPDSVGRPFPVVDVRVVDDPGNHVHDRRRRRAVGAGSPGHPPLLEQPRGNSRCVHGGLVPHR